MPSKMDLPDRVGAGQARQCLSYLIRTKDGDRKDRVILIDDPELAARMGRVREAGTRITIPIQVNKRSTVRMITGAVIGGDDYTMPESFTRWIFWFRSEA